MKIAISGKGGVGKSTLAAMLALLYKKRGYKVLALDADPDANLASALGIKHEVQAQKKPISKQIELIEERTGAKVNQYGQVFQMNPKVSDVAETFAYKHDGIDVLVLGAVKAGGSGCACPESTFIRALVCDLILFKDELLIMDMEAGVEHLGRATASGVDVMIVVVEPGQRSIDCADSIIKMASDIGIKRLEFVANKINTKEDEDFVRASLPKEPLALIRTSDALKSADRDGVSVMDMADAETLSMFEGIIEKIEGSDK